MPEMTLQTFKSIDSTKTLNISRKKKGGGGVQQLFQCKKSKRLITSLRKY